MITSNSNTDNDSKIIKKTLLQIRRETYSLFCDKYKSDSYNYQKKIINEIIYNEKSRVVAVFKDFLILDDISEFLRRFYSHIESNLRLTKVIEFYETYSRIFPNYIIIPESKYLYKNIRRKQKMIDAHNQIKSEEEDNRKKVGIGINNIIGIKKPNFFDSEIKRSILRIQPSYNYMDSSIMNTTSNRTNTSILRIHDDSVSLSLNANKNILENEESILSIKTLLNVMENKNITSKIKVNKLLPHETKKKLKLILNENILKGKNLLPGSKSKNGMTLKVNVNNQINHINHINQINHINAMSSVSPMSNNLITNQMTMGMGMTMAINNPLNNHNSQTHFFHPYYQTKSHFDNNKVIKETAVSRVSSPSAYIIPPNSNSSNLNNIKTEQTMPSGPNLDSKPFIKKLPLKNLNIKEQIITTIRHETTTTPNFNTEPSQETKKIDMANKQDKSRMGTHRISSSIPKLYSSLKIINNYPNIIIPSGSTHVSINQNYYNYEGTSYPAQIGARIITLENLGANYSKGSASKLVNEERVNINNNNDNNNNKLSKLIRKKTFSKEFSYTKISNLVTSTGTGLSKVNHITPKNLKLKTMKNNNYNLHTGGHGENINTNTNINIKNAINPIHKSNNKQSYSKVFKVFQDNFNNINSMDGSKNRKLKENATGTGSIGNYNNHRERNEMEPLIFKKETTDNIQIQDETGILETDRQIKSRIEIKEAYKKYLERNKLECLTARNSLEKPTYPYKMLNTENFKSRVYLSAHNSVNFNATNSNDNNTFSSKKNLYLSPTNLNKIRSQQCFNKINFKVETPVKSASKHNLIKQIEIKDESTSNKSKIKSYFGGTMRDAPKSTKKIEGMKILFSNPFDSTNINSITGKTPSSRINKPIKSVVKSLDFQTLKNLKK